MTAEEKRLQASRERTVHWKRWGPYLSERSWATVREDYSSNGTAWEYLPHDHARSKAYRWGEDGIAGISDRRQFLCFAIALWNGRDPILKERLFGLTGNEGNHAEDVKEYYFYLDSTPTHSYMKYLYKYPRAEYPYARLVGENRIRGREAPEFELLDTCVFAENRYFDVMVEYAKATPEDICIRIRVTNHGPEAASLDLLPTLWFRNTWSWGEDAEKPRMWQAGDGVVECHHDYLGCRMLFCEGTSELLFTENETNSERLYGQPNASPYVKDGINEAIVHGDPAAVNPEHRGTKTSARYHLEVPAGGTAVVRLRLADGDVRGGEPARSPFDDFEQVFAERIAEADEFYARLAPLDASDDAKNVQRQAFAGMLWSKQFYYYDVRTWLRGDPGLPPPPPERKNGRNHEWKHLYNSDVISMPDKWEYPWYAVWDLAFHCIPLALVDSDFAKEQLILMLREWYMHPNGQIPAYEWAFGDVNPPVHAWAAWRVYKIDKKRHEDRGDLAFLERIFHKLLLNFTWWVNRKDSQGNNIFEGGFLGLDNIGIFDRSAPLPTGGFLEQSDGTSWMAMYTLNMLAISLELASHNPAYEDVASKFFEHFVHITHAMNHMGDHTGLWDEGDGFYYDVLHFPDGRRMPLKVRSLVGLIPLYAVEVLEPGVIDRLPGFKRRMEWFLNNHDDIRHHIDIQRTADGRTRRLLSLVNLKRLPRVLRYLLDGREFFSPYGIRSVSRIHGESPFCLYVDGHSYCVDYEPAESSSSLFGGNSNWRGPIWFPVNFLLVESLQRFHYFTGDDFQVECPTGSGRMLTLWDVAGEISRNLSHIFLRNPEGHRPVYGGTETFQTDPHWRDLILFYEYFHGDNGAGIGASHQTGWTGLVAKLLQQSGE
jgi:hypothetical protein